MKLSKAKKTTCLLNCLLRVLRKHFIVFTENCVCEWAITKKFVSKAIEINACGFSALEEDVPTVHSLSGNLSNNR